MQNESTCYTEFLWKGEITKEVLIDKFVEILPDKLIHCKFVQEEKISSKICDDGSFYAGRERIVFSENGSGWYAYYNEKIYKVKDETIKHLCKTCIESFAECNGKPVFSIECDPSLDGADADMVVECDEYNGPDTITNCVGCDQSL